MKVTCIIPARGGSKRLPRKNIHPLLGKPLICWSIDACLGSKYLNRENIFVSTEDQEIKDIVKDYGINVIDRPQKLSEDSVWTQEVLSHAKLSLEKMGVDFDIMVRIQANSPQIESKKIDECIEKLIDKELWEVFTVDKDGIEDAAVHVLLEKCVNQRALSVYKGVVGADYIDIHEKEDIYLVEKEISKRGKLKIMDSEYDIVKKAILNIAKARVDEIEEFIRNERESVIDKFYPKFLKIPKDIPETPRGVFEAEMVSWHWNEKIPILDRISLALDRHRPFFLHLTNRSGEGKPIKVLDLGCGFCTYWPILFDAGVTEIVGIDIYGERDYVLASNTTYDVSKTMLSHSSHFIESLKSHPDEKLFKFSRKDIGELSRVMWDAFNVLQQIYCRINQQYLSTARKLVFTFLPDSSVYRIFQGDVRSIDSFLSYEDRNAFDLIMCLNPGKAKSGFESAGIPVEIFAEIREKYLKKDGVTAFDEL